MIAQQVVDPLHLACAGLAVAFAPRGVSGSFETVLAALERAAPPEWRALPSWPADGAALAARLDAEAEGLARVGVRAVVRHKGRRIVLVAAVAGHSRPVAGRGGSVAALVASHLSRAVAGLRRAGAAPTPARLRQEAFRWLAAAIPFALASGA